MSAGQWERRFLAAYCAAEEAWWAAIRAAYPEAKTGDTSPIVDAQFQVAGERAIADWLRKNLPEWPDLQPTTPEEIRARLTAEGITARCWGHWETDEGMEVEANMDEAPGWFHDTHAVLLHRVECGCLEVPENRDYWNFYGGRTQMPFPTFTATVEDLG